jgi:hypothetical protein
MQNVKTHGPTIIGSLHWRMRPSRSGINVSCHDLMMLREAAHEKAPANKMTLIAIQIRASSHSGIACALRSRCTVLVSRLRCEASKIRRSTEWSPFLRGVGWLAKRVGLRQPRNSKSDPGGYGSVLHDQLSPGETGAHFMPADWVRTVRHCPP